MLSYSYKKHRFKQKKPHLDKVSKIQEPVIHGGRLLQISCFQWSTVSSVLKLSSSRSQENSIRPAIKKKSRAPCFLMLVLVPYNHLNQSVRILVRLNVTVY